MKPGGLIVHVEEEDIREGTRRAPCDCPIARALRRQTGFTFIVNNNRIDGGYAGYADLPEVACEFIHHFDHGDAVDPFSFEVRMQPPEAEELTNGQEE